MLSSISWQQYLAAITILTVSYYLYVILRYYQNEIFNLFNHKQNSTRLFSNASPAPYQVMGEAKLDNGVTLTQAQDLHFIAEEDVKIQPTQTINTTVTETAYNPSQDLVAEAGNLIAAFKEIDNKQEFINLLRILFESYKRFKAEIDWPAALHRIAELSKEKLMFPVDLTDLQDSCASTL